MRSANLFGPLKGLCPHKALIGLTQASGLAGGFDLESAALNQIISQKRLMDGVQYPLFISAPQGSQQVQSS